MENFVTTPYVVLERLEGFSWPPTTNNDTKSAINLTNLLLHKLAPGPSTGMLMADRARTEPIDRSMGKNYRNLLTLPSLFQSISEISRGERRDRELELLVRGTHRMYGTRSINIIPIKSLVENVMKVTSYYAYHSTEYWS